MTLREITAQEITLAPGATYYAMLLLEGLEATFATAGIIEGKFASLGFEAIGVWDAAASVPEDFPLRTPFPSGRTFWVRGQWHGEPQSKALPSQVKRVWTDATPAAAAPPPAASPAPAPGTPTAASPAPDGASWTAPPITLPEVTITSSTPRTGTLLLILAALMLFSKQEP